MHEKEKRKLQSRGCTHGLIVLLKIMIIPLALCGFLEFVLKPIVFEYIESKSSLISPAACSRPEVSISPTIWQPVEDPGFMIEAIDHPSSTFNLHVDSSSYEGVYDALHNMDYLPGSDWVNVEGFINFIPGDYPFPSEGEAFTVQIDAVPSVFGAPDQILLRVGVQAGANLPVDHEPVLYVLVVDVSWSTSLLSHHSVGYSPSILMEQMLERMLEFLNPDDQVAIVTFAQNANLILLPTPASDRDRIITAIQRRVKPWFGGTNIVAGINLGYQIAHDNRTETNKVEVILLSDSPTPTVTLDELELRAQHIQEAFREGAKEGIHLKVVDFLGGDGYWDSPYADFARSSYFGRTIRDAQDFALYSIVGSSVIARQVGIVVQFNPDIVQSYRLIGYENRDVNQRPIHFVERLSNGASVTALYEITLMEGSLSGRLATTSLYYVELSTRQQHNIETSLDIASIYPNFGAAPVDLQMQIVLGEFGEILDGSPAAADSSLDAVLSILRAVPENIHKASVWDTIEKAHRIRSENRQDQESPYIDVCF